MASRALLETVWKESFARVMGFAQENTVPGREEVTDLLSDREYWARLQSPGGAAALGVLLEAVTARLESQDEEISDLRRLSGLEGGNGGKTKADPTGQNGPMVNPANTPLPSKKDLMTPLAGLPRDQAIALAMRKYGIDELDAAFLVDIEQGVISGDTVGPKGHPDTVNRPS